MHPDVLRVMEMEDFDDRLLNEMYGWVDRCATQCAAYDGDYVVDLGTASIMAGPSRFQALKAAAIYCGLFEPVEKVDEKTGKTRPMLKLIEDQDLFHMLLKSDKERDANRRKDNNDKAKKAELIKRDGSNCRWCDRVVTFNNDRKSIKQGTIDHLNPNDLDDATPTPIERLVIACFDCNSKRQDGEHWTRELLPEPTHPYYSEDAAAWLSKHAGIVVQITKPRAQLHAPGTLIPITDHVKAPAAKAATEIDEATDTSGSSARTGQKVPARKPVEAPTATANTPASAEHTQRSIDHLAMEQVEWAEVARSSTTSPGEDPDKVEPPAAPSAATGTTGAPVAAETEKRIKTKSKQNQLIIKNPRDDESGFAGTGRDGTGQVGTGRDGNASSQHPSAPVNDSKPRRRRNRPRRRKN